MSTQEKQRAAADAQAAIARQQEYMALAPGIGIVPESFRNLGYKKLEYEPGQGGIGALLADKAPQQKGSDGAAVMDSFLAGVAAGADPQQLASELRSGKTTTTGRASRRPTPEATS